MKKKGKRAVSQLKKEIRSLHPVDVVLGVGLLLYLVAYPFYVRDRYFSMTVAKNIFFYCITGVFAVTCLIVRRAMRERLSFPLVRKNRTELYFLLFIGFAVLSCACAESPLDALAGDTGRYMGLLTFLVIWAAYIFVSRFGRLKAPVLWVFGVSIIAMNVIAFLQFIGLDPFHLYAGTKAYVKETFMSMLGNKDVFYYYLSLAVPFSMYLTFDAESRWERGFWYAVVFCGFVGSIACNCDGAFICLIISFIYFFFTRCKDREGLLQYLGHVLLLIAAGLLLSPLKAHLNELGIKQTVVMQYVATPYVCGPALAVFAVLFLLVLKKETPPRFYSVLQKTVKYTLLAVAVCLVSAFIWFTFFDRKTDLGLFSTFLRFYNNWGSKRGLIWNMLFKIYSEKFPFYRWLIGSGEETVAMLMKRYYADLLQRLGKTFDNAHNEYLQYLVTHGLLGLASYVLFAFSAVKRGFREGGRYQRAAALAAVCCLAQAFVNIIQALATPLLFVFLAMAQTTDPPQEPLPPRTERMQWDDSQIVVNKRKTAACVLLSLVTLGFYAIYWMYLLVRNVRAIDGKKTRCAGEMLCLLFVPFYPLYWWYTRGNTVKQAFADHGCAASGGGVAFLLLNLFGLPIIAMALMQKNFNLLPTETVPADGQSDAAEPLPVPAEPDENAPGPKDNEPPEEDVPAAATTALPDNGDENR